jgi:hypothetical protein
MIMFRDFKVFRIGVTFKIVEGAIFDQKFSE